MKSKLRGKPYGLRAGDEVIFSAQLPVLGERRVENGITGTVLDADRDRDRVTVATHEREPREVAVDTAKFSDLNLGYAVHLYKAQGITAETSGILTGGWQTDREHAYVALSRARERTQVYVAREDLGEQGMDTGAIERLGERLRRSGAQEASVSREVDEHITERAAQLERDSEAFRARQERELDCGFGIE
jgi:ATP-dependent exoDNAse (exonuclease V) alpha subunit